MKSKSVAAGAATLTLGRTAARLSRALDVALAAVDLSQSQYRVLMFLADGDVAASTLAEKLAITRPSVTTVVDGLVVRGLVERSPDPQDRRKVDHAITDEGRRTLSDADEAVDEMLRKLSSVLAAEDRDAAFRGLEQWGAAMDTVRQRFREESQR